MSSGPERKVILLFSGGMDSTVLLYRLRLEGFEPEPLFVGYGQRHMQAELQAAGAIAREFGVALRFAGLPSIATLWGPNALTGGANLEPAGVTPGNTVVPGRNLVLLSLANVVRLATGAGGGLAIGCNADDAELYEDCRTDFLFRLADLLGTQIRCLIGETKANIAREGVRMRVPLEATWSCYAGGALQCGQCDACVRRANALAEVDLHPFRARLGGTDLTE